MLKEHSQTTTQATTRISRPGFTLVELIIVILIIAVVIAISLPALGMANVAAKKAKSQMLATNLGAAIASYQNDKNNLPGYFSAAEMGAAANTTRGFTSLENAMLDLMGGVVPSTATGPSIIQVGPNSSGTVPVDLELIGTNTGSNTSYFNPEKKAYVAQNGIDGGLQEAVPEHQALPDLVDAFGTPLLLWIENPSAKGTIVKSSNNTNGVPFALVDSGSSMDKAARFYWASNAGFLNSTQLGAIGRSQARQGSDPRFSLIGGGLPAKSREESLMGLLGSPTNANVDVNGVAAQDVVPGDARGGFTIQLAGPDGIYVSSTDKGASRFAGSTINYWNTWFVNGSTRVTNANGKPSSKDLIIDAFDDFLLTGAH
jgi:prepilin-type N-terminal cleavage/methylation domain-containing protein